MIENSKYDVIIIGAGMGGLSVGAFLAKESKNVLILEKHDKPGGYATSFTRKGYTFDCSIAHLNELGEGQTIPNFLKYWGGKISVKRMFFKFKYFIGSKEFFIDTKNLENGLINYFPEKEAQIKKYLSLTYKIMEEAISTGAPKPPFEMNLIEKISFGLRALIKKPNIMKYGLKQHNLILKQIIDDKYLESIFWAFYPINSLNFMSNAWAWEKIRLGEYYYPIGGIQAIPGAVVDTIIKNGSEIIYKTEVTKIIIENKKAIGVECKNRKTFYSDIVISNASLHHTLFNLCNNIKELDKLRISIEKRNLFVSCFAIYLGVDNKYDLNNIDYFFFLDETTKDIDESNLTPENCPILMMVTPKQINQEHQSVLVGAIIPYEYKNNWLTGPTNKRNKDYYKLKDEVKNIILKRISENIGEDFINSINYSMAATPLTFERYTYNKYGSIMGWKIEKKYFGKFIPFDTSIKDLYFVGQWVYPGGGVPAVIASGYYLAKKILSKNNINLEYKLKNLN